VAIMTAICLLHGLFLSWQHFHDNLVDVGAPGALVVTLSEAAQIKTPSLPKKRRVITPSQASVPALPVESVAENTIPSSVPHKAAQDLKQMYLAELRAMIERNKVYPLQASRLGQMGIVEVSFTLTVDGHIIDLRISRPCPFQRLNEAALVAVKSLGQFRPIPSELGAKELEVKVPVRYSRN
jgi:protein TonB